MGVTAQELERLMVGDASRQVFRDGAAHFPTTEEATLTAYQPGMIRALMATPCPASTKLLVYSKLAQHVLFANQVALMVGEAIVSWLQSIAPNSKHDRSTDKERLLALSASGEWLGKACVPAEEMKAFEAAAAANDTAMTDADRTQAMILAVMATPCPPTIKTLVYVLLTKQPDLTDDLALFVGEAFTAWMRQLVGVDGQSKRTLRSRVRMQGDGHLSADALAEHIRAVTGEGDNLQLHAQGTIWLCDVIGCGATFTEPGHLDGFECRACERRYDSCKGSAHESNNLRRTCPLCASHDTIVL